MNQLQLQMGQGERGEAHLATVPLLIFSGIVLSGLGAYSAWSVPLQWLAPLPFILALVNMASGGASIHIPRVALIYIGLLVWAACVTTPAVFSFALSDTRPLVFVALRFLKIAAFLAILVQISNLDRFSRDYLSSGIIAIGVAFSLYGIFCYFAQLYGWHEIPRTRSATSVGGSQSTVFTYPFHRLMGPFQEPSLFADWMLLPIFISFARAQRDKWPFAGIILGATMLTGSFSAAIAISIGVFVVLLKWLFSKEKGKWPWVALNISVALLIFCICVREYGPSTNSPFQLAWSIVENRLAPTLQGGLGATNRAEYVAYADALGVDLLGKGLGVASYQMDPNSGDYKVVNFLSLYRLILASTGIIGLAILIAALVGPLAGARSSQWLDSNIWVIGCYVACCVMFYAVMEELTFSFAVVVGLLVARDENKSARHRVEEDVP